MKGATVIERYAEPLPGGRAQLVETVFDNGEQLYTIRRGSPARADVVRRYAETLTLTNTGITRRTHG